MHSPPFMVNSSDALKFEKFALSFLYFGCFCGAGCSVSVLVGDHKEAVNLYSIIYPSF